MERLKFFLLVLFSCVSLQIFSQQTNCNYTRSQRQTAFDFHGIKVFYWLQYSTCPHPEGCTPIIDIQKMNDRNFQFQTRFTLEGVDCFTDKTERAEFSANDMRLNGSTYHGEWNINIFKKVNKVTRCEVSFSLDEPGENGVSYQIIKDYENNSLSIIRNGRDISESELFSNSSNASNQGNNNNSIAGNQSNSTSNNSNCTNTNGTTSAKKSNEQVNNSKENYDNKQIQRQQQNDAMVKATADFAGAMINLGSVLSKQKRERQEFKNYVIGNRDDQTYYTFANEYNTIYVSSFEGYHWILDIRSGFGTDNINNNYIKKSISKRINNKNYGSAARQISDAQYSNIEPNEFNNTYREGFTELEPNCSCINKDRVTDGTFLKRGLTPVTDYFLNDFEGNFCRNAKSKNNFDYEFSVFNGMKGVGPGLIKKAEKGDLFSNYILGVFYHEVAPVNFDLSSKYFQLIVNSQKQHKEYYLKLGYFYLGTIKKYQGLKNNDRSKILESNDLLEKAYLINSKTWIESINALKEDHGRQDKTVFDFMQFAIMRELVSNMSCVLGNTGQDRETNSWCQKAMWYFSNFPKQDEEDNFSLAPDFGNDDNTNSSNTNNSPTSKNNTSSENTDRDNNSSSDINQLFKQANNLYLSEKYSECVQTWDKIILSNPENAYAYNNRALAKKQMGDKQGACQDFQTAQSKGVKGLEKDIEATCKN